MSFNILTSLPHYNQNLSALAQQIFPSIGPQSERYHSKNANVKRILPTLLQEADSAPLIKKIQLSDTESVTKASIQTKTSTRVRDRKSGTQVPDNSRRANKAARKEASKEADLVILADIAAFFFDRPHAQTQNPSEDASLIGVNLFKTSLSNQTPEESKLEEIACASPKSTKKLPRGKMNRVQSKNSLQDMEDSTAQSEQDDQEVLNLETPVKNNALPEVQDQEIVSTPIMGIETTSAQTISEEVICAPKLVSSESEVQKIVEIQIGEKHQVSNEYLAKIGSLAPRKSKPVLKYSPEEGREEKVAEFMTKLEGKLKVGKISHEVKVIDILIKQNWDVDNSLMAVSDKISHFRTFFNPNARNTYGTRSKNS